MPREQLYKILDMCKNLIKGLAAIEKDKWMHFAVSMLLTLVLYAICSACGLGSWTVAPAFVVTMGIGVIKEKLDAKRGGQFDHNDIAADFFGCFTAIILIALLLIK